MRIRQLSKAASVGLVIFAVGAFAPVVYAQGAGGGGSAAGGASTSGSPMGNPGMNGPVTSPDNSAAAASTPIPGAPSGPNWHELE